MQQQQREPTHSLADVRLAGILLSLYRHIVVVIVSLASILLSLQNSNIVVNAENTDSLEGIVILLYYRSQTLINQMIPFMVKQLFCICSNLLGVVDIAGSDPSQQRRRT